MKRRMNNIFRENGKAFVVALDHGTGSNCLPDLKEPGKIIEACVRGGADAFLVTPGMSVRFQKEIGSKGLVLRADGGSNTLSPDAPFKQAVTVEQALRVGADAVLCMDMPGSAYQNDTSDTVHDLVRGGNEWNLPVGIEPLDYGFEFGKHDAIRSVESITLVARMATERGADFVKIPYTGSKETFKELVDSCYVPVLVLGGSKRKDVDSFFQDLRDAMDAGAAGVIIGRNIYSHESPEKMSAAIAALVHDDATVAQAVAILEA